MLQSIIACDNLNTMLLYSLCFVPNLSTRMAKQMYTPHNSCFQKVKTTNKDIAPDMLNSFCENIHAQCLMLNMHKSHISYYNLSWPLQFKTTDITYEQLYIIAILPTCV